MDERRAIIQLFQEVGKHYYDRCVACFEVHDEHDVHAFYRLSSAPSKVVHVQGYPGLSSAEQARVWARIMDYNKMIALRNSGTVSIGNEHEAAIQQFPNFESGIFMPYDARVLEGKLAENVKEVKED
jgi:hypothetical protein